MDHMLWPHCTYDTTYLDDIIIYGNNCLWHMDDVNVVIKSSRPTDLKKQQQVKSVIERVGVLYLDSHLSHGQMHL